jgi:CarD family transcriptional regulator
MAFEVGDKCVVPALGVGVVREIKALELEDHVYEVYEIKILDNGATYTTPTDQADANGIRIVIPFEAVGRVYEILKDRDTPTDKQTWNRRYREYMSKIKTGDPLEVAAVLRDLALLRQGKTLSFGERKMFDQAHSLIVQEIAVARDVNEEVIKEEIEEIFAVKEEPEKDEKK